MCCLELNENSNETRVHTHSSPSLHSLLLGLSKPSSRHRIRSARRTDVTSQTNRNSAYIATSTPSTANCTLGLGSLEPMDLATCCPRSSGWPSRRQSRQQLLQARHCLAYADSARARA